MLLPAAMSLMALMGTSGAASAYEMDVYVRSNDRETVFLAPPEMAEGGTLPVFRICYRNQSTLPPPETLSVHIGNRHQLLSRGRCSFFAGNQIDLAVWKGDGAILASVTLLR